MSLPSIRWWQRALSYLTEVHLEARSSAYNPILDVSLVKNRLQLSTEKSIYSFDDYYLNFMLAFRQVQLPDDQSEVLVMGLGLASVPYMLESVFNKTYFYAAVEIDEAVIELAAKYTLSRLESSIEVFNADAEVFVQMHRQQYDLVIVDLFLEDVIPPYFEQKEGNLQVQELLKPEGRVMYNRLYRSAADKSRTEAFYKDVFAKVFPHAEALEVGGNMMLMGSK